MGISNSQDRCPTHRKSFEKLCICEECIEPLCSQCISQHLLIHEKMGFPAKI